MVKEFVEQLEKLVENATNIVIVGHFNPDGDSVGSVTGMRRYLEMAGKNPKVLLPSKYPDFLSFLDADSDYTVEIRANSFWMTSSKENICAILVDYLTMAN